MGIDVKSDATSKETMISCGPMVLAEIFSTKSLLFLTVYLLVSFDVVFPEIKCLTTTTLSSMAHSTNKYLATPWAHQLALS